MNTHPLKGQRIVALKQDDSRLDEVYAAAGLMPLLDGKKVVWHACSGTSTDATMCGITWDAAWGRDPKRLTSLVMFVCETCKVEYEKYPADGNWEDGVRVTEEVIRTIAERPSTSKR